MKQEHKLKVKACKESEKFLNKALQTLNAVNLSSLQTEGLFFEIKTIIRNYQAAHEKHLTKKSTGIL